MEDKFVTEFLDQSIYRLGLNYPRIEICLNSLTDEEIWNKPNSSSNSIGNLILHLSGNITQYILSALGGKADNRKRDEEFNTKGGRNKTELLMMLKNISDEAGLVIKNMDSDRLVKTYKVQGYSLTGIAIIIHVVEHYSYHTGQITLLTKLLKDIDTGYYKGMDLNSKNEL
jgi:uncharacterized damage-inducible protein DinB